MFSVNRRMAQLEDEFLVQQGQLEILRKTLANVVDVATHRFLKESVTAELKTKVDTEVAEAQHKSLAKAQSDLLEVLANKVDAWALQECRRELAHVTDSGIPELERQYALMAQAITEDRAGVDDLRREQARILTDFERQQEALATSLANKAQADAVEFEEYRRQVASMMKESANQLEDAIADSSREHYSALTSVRMDNEVMQQTFAEALQRHGSAMDSAREELAALSGLEQRFKEFQEEAYEKQEDWLRAKEKAANEIYSITRARRDEEFAEALSKKADLTWYQQQQALLDATQLSVTQQQNGLEDLQLKLLDKVDGHTLQRTEERFLLEISQARQETADVSCKFDLHQHHVDLARAQLIELSRQHGELEASLRGKADKASLEGKQMQLETLSSKLEDIERRQDDARQEFIQLQEQFFAALGRRPSAVATSNLGFHRRMIAEPPPSPREKLACIKPSSARSKYGEPPYRCEASPTPSARRKMGGN